MSKTRILSLWRRELALLNVVFMGYWCDFIYAMIIHPHLMYCSDLLYFFARYLAEALLGILTKDSSLLYLVMLHGVSHTQ